MNDLPVTGLTLEEFRQSFAMHPYHFWGMADSGVLRVSAQCPSVVRAYAWQDVDAAGRADILDAIARAEEKLLRYLAYRPFPAYDAVTLPWPTYGDPRLTRTGPWGTDGRWLSVTLPEGEVRACGVEARTLIDAQAAVVFTDPDGDGVDELATVTVATSVTDASEIAVYVQESDRLPGDALSERYRVRPVTVQLAGGTATIRIPSWLLVRPINYEGFAATDLNPATPGVLATAVDVYRRTTNTDGTTAQTAQATIIWETRPCHGWWCGCGCQGASDPYAGSPDDPAATAQAAARVALRNQALGIVGPAEAAYNATTGVWSALDWSVCTPPDRVTVRYLAGVASPDGQRMASAWRIPVARLAAAELGRPVCGCDAANRELYRWQFDLASIGQQQAAEQYAISPGDLDNPFGTRRGHVEAWKWVQRRQRTLGIYAG